MGLFNWLKKAEVKQADSMSMFGFKDFADYFLMKDDKKTYTLEGYNKAAVVYACINAISQCVSDIEVEITIDDEPVPNHPLQKLLDKPNPITSYQYFIKQLVSYYQITGDTFCERLMSSQNLPIELWSRMPYHIKPEIGSSMIPLSYVLKDDANTIKKTWKVDPLTADCDLLHLKLFNPLDPFMGMSPIQAAAMSVDGYNKSNKWNNSLLDNNAKPSGYIKANLDMYTSLTPEQRQRLENDFAAYFSGSKNAGKTPVMYDGIDFTALSLSPIDMDFLNGHLNSAQEITQVFRVPTQIIGLPGSQTYANYEEARLAFWEDTIINLAKTILDSLIDWLKSNYPDGDRIWYRMKLDEIPALANKAANTRLQLDQVSYLTINEKRQMAGLAPLDEPIADELLLSTGLAPISDYGTPLDLESDNLSTEEIDELGIE